VSARCFITGATFYNGGSMSHLDELFSDSVRLRIREAVEQAEVRTSGEIVPYVVAASDTYAAAYWLSALLGALLAPLIALGASEVLEIWGLPVGVWLITPTLAGAAFGYLAAWLIPAWRRVLIGDSTLDRRTRRRAAVAFLEEEIFKTRDRTGVLVFLSLFEHRVVVLGDEGINRAVAPEAWQAIVDRVGRGIGQGRAAEALVEAMGDCGRLLEEHKVTIQDDDTDELSDELRKRES